MIGNGTSLILDGVLYNLNSDKVAVAIADLEEVVANLASGDNEGNSGGLPPIGTSANDCTWEQINAICEAGKAQEYFKLGDIKTITIDGYGDVVMEIVAFNADDKADGTGKAAISWVSRGVITDHVMNEYNTNTDGWAVSDMRTWLQGEFYNALPADVKAFIVSVNKTYYDYTTQTTKSCTDNVWIPSVGEIFGNSYDDRGCEDSGAEYTDYFNSDSARIKKDASGSASTWFLRSAYNVTSIIFRAVNSSGIINNLKNAYYEEGVVLGFCTGSVSSTPSVYSHNGSEDRYKIIVNDTEYYVDASKLSTAIADIEAVLGGLEAVDNVKTTWEAVDFGNSSQISGQYIWTDGVNIYFSKYANQTSSQYVLNGTTWETMTWSGFEKPYGGNIWTDGKNIYYSSGKNQYVLNGTTWETMTWSGLTTKGLDYAWTDGTNIYGSNSYNEQYVLNGTTWETMTWGGFNNPRSTYIWTDGTKFYYSYGKNHYVLNGTTWETMTWGGLTYIYGQDIWTDGKNIYYSSGKNQYVLNGTTWETMTWSGLNDFDGQDIWTDGKNIYYSDGSNQYVLK